MKRGWAVVQAAALLSACSPTSRLPGSYMMSDDHGAYMVRLGTVQDNAVTGDITAIIPDGHGAINAIKNPLRGSIEGKALNLTVETSTGPALMTGTVLSNGLDLTIFGYGLSQRVMLTKRKAEDFTELETTLRDHVARERQADAEAIVNQAQGLATTAAQDQINRLTAMLDGKINAMPGATARLNLIGREYDADVTRINFLSATTRNNGQGDNDVPQIDQRQSLINGIRASHDQLQASIPAIDQVVAGRDAAVAADISLCRRNSRLSCDSLQSAISLYHHDILSLRGAIEKENNAYNAAKSEIRGG